MLFNRQKKLNVRIADLRQENSLAVTLREAFPLFLYAWKQSFALTNSFILIILLRPFRDPVLNFVRFMSAASINVKFQSHRHH